MQQANGSNLRGTASPEGWRASHHYRRIWCERRYLRSREGLVPVSAFAVSYRQNANISHLRRVYSSFERLREVKSLGVFQGFLSGVNA